jgi:3-methylcrotonyl-CoA carboxylase alpha subunit
VPSKREVRWREVAAEVEVLADGRLKVGDHAFSARSSGRGEWRLEGSSAAARVWVAGPAEAPWVFFEGRAFRLDVGPAGRVRRARHDGPESLAAPMPATVRDVLVSVGQQVRRGEVLVVLEAMKMELPLRAPADGTIAEVRCTPGELVQPGAPLIGLR